MGGGRGDDKEGAERGGEESIAAAQKATWQRCQVPLTQLGPPFIFRRNTSPAIRQPIRKVDRVRPLSSCWFGVRAYLASRVVMYAPRRRRRCDRAAAMGWQWSPPSLPPSLIYLILLRSRSSSSSFSTRPFIHSFHSFVRSFGRSGELKKELVFRNRPSRFGVIRHEVGTQRPIPRSLSPRAGETRNPGCPSDRPILLLEPSSPRIGTCSSSSSWLRRRRRPRRRSFVRCQHNRSSLTND